MMRESMPVLVDSIAAQGATVEVYEIRRTWIEFGVPDLLGFEVRSSTGYLATFPEAHTECERTVCVKQRGHSTVDHDIRHCHGLHHIEQVTALAREVAATYGSAGKGLPDASRGWPANPLVGGYPAGTRQGWTGHRVTLLNKREWAETEWAKTMEVQG